MNLDFVTHLKAEIAELSDQLARDNRPRKLAELKKILALYTDASDGTEQSAPNTVTIRRRVSPETMLIIRNARIYLSNKSEPTPTRDILAELEKKNIPVTGESPVNNLSAILSNSYSFDSHGRSGWTLSAKGRELLTAG